MSQMGKQWSNIDRRIKKNNPAMPTIAQIKSLSPLAIMYNGIEISLENGDNIYLNNLITDEAISFTQAQPITCSDGTITENHTDIINAITDWLVAVHTRYIIGVGDLVAVQKLGNNTYIVLEKVQKIE